MNTENTPRLQHGVERTALQELAPVEREQVEGGVIFITDEYLRFRPNPTGDGVFCSELVAEAY